METTNVTHKPPAHFLEWCGFGALSGLIAAIVEPPFILDGTVSIPALYAPILFLFNLIFWMLFYAGAGYVFLKITRINTASRYRSIAPEFAIALFALIYGVISKTGLFNYFSSFFTPCFDRHLSFVWVTCAGVFAWFLRKSRTQPTSFPLSYTPDIAVVVALFLFCSNTHAFLKYITGVAAIFAVYFSLLFFEKWFIKKPILTYSVLCLLAIGSPTTCYLITNNPLSNYVYPSSSTPVVQRPSVILIVLDTLRADRLSLYGGPVPVPHLEAFARDAILFERCIANSSWTPPSHASLFTGLYPSEHGCISDIAPGRFPVLATSLKTLAEIFQEQGYQTMGIVANFGYLGRGTNFDQGFQLYDCRKGIGSIFTDYPARPPVHIFSGVSGLLPKLIVPYPVAEDITTTVKKVLNQCAAKTFFLFINYMDPHSPYYPPSSYMHDFTHDRLALWKRVAITPTMGKNSIYNRFWLSQYDGEIAYLDAQLGLLFAHLKNLGLYDKTLIIVSSDHGEMFGEHGLADHRCELYQEVVHVPLIVKFPGNKNAGRRESNLLTLRDVFYIAIDECNLPASKEITPEGESPFKAVAEFQDERYGLQQAFYYQDYKYMIYEKNKNPQLFNLKQDSTELMNIAQDHPEIVKTFETRIQAWQKMHVPKKQKNTSNSVKSEDVLKRLQSLGYIK